MRQWRERRHRVSSDQWWEQVEARRAAEPEMAGIRADSNDEVDDWEEREADLEPNMQGRASQKKPGGPGMMPPMMGGMPGGAGGGAAAGARPMGPAATGPVGGEGTAVMQAAGMSAATRAGGGGAAGLGVGSAGAGSGGLGSGGLGAGGLGAGGLGAGGLGVGAAGAPGGGAGGVAAAGAGPGAGADLDGDGVPDAEETPGETENPGGPVDGPVPAPGPTPPGPTPPGPTPQDPPPVEDGPGSFTVDPDQLRAIASRWDAMSNRANQLSVDSSTARSDFALLADADSSHHELTGKATNWSAGAGTEFRDLNNKLTSAADEYKAAEESGVVQAGKVN